ncbi:MAG TPA: hypothetical protein VF376_01985 [Thermoanaerobaculia bacterium]
MGTRTRRNLTFIAFVAGFAPLIWAGASDSPSGGSAPKTAAACPADDRLASHEDLAQTASSSPDSRSAQEAWLAERERVLSSLAEVRRPDGTVSVDLQDAFLSRIVMQRNPDGSVSIRCFPAGARVVLAPAPAHLPHEEK